MVVSRNADRAKRRRQKASALSRSEPFGPVTLLDCTVLDDPSDVEVVPHVSPSVFEPRSQFPVFDSDSDEEKAEDNSATAANPTTPRAVWG